MKKIRIVFIIWSYSYGGGAESLLTNIVNNLNSDKYDISIIELIHANYKVEPTNDNIHILPYITEENAPDKSKKMFDVLHRPWKIFNEYIGDGFDIYISFNYQRPSFLLQPNKRNIAWIHTDVYDLLDGKMIEEKVWQDEVFFKCNRIVAISDITETSLKILFDRHVDRICKIYNGIDIDRVKQLADLSSDLQINEQSVCFVGRLDDRKNPIRALNIFKKLYELKPLCHIYFLGDGHLKEDLICCAQEMGIEDKVHVLGYCENPFPIMKQCSAILQTSKSEGFLMVLLESLCLGVPFVSTDVGAARMMSYDGVCGSIFESDDEAVTALNKLLFLSGENRNEIRDACEESASRFALEKYIAQIEALIDEVVKE